MRGGGESEGRGRVRGGRSKKRRGGISDRKR